MSKRRRVVFRVKPCRVRWLKPPRKAWKITRKGKQVGGTFGRKVDAVSAGRRAARAEYERGTLTQLVVHRRDGRFHFENTYGDDPRRSPG